jgi:hypothetical protein
MLSLRRLPARELCAAPWVTIATASTRLVFPTPSDNPRPRTARARHCFTDKLSFVLLSDPRREPREKSRENAPPPVTPHESTPLPN